MRRATALITAALSGLTGVTAYSAGAGDAAEDPAPQETHYVSISWAEGPVTLDELTELADTVAQVTITDVVGTGNIDSDVDASIPYTDFSATVADTLVGDAQDSITIRQSGGSSNGAAYVVSDDPLMEAGDQYVLFLTEYQPGQYRINAGPSGRFVLDGDSVSPLATTGIEEGQVAADLAGLASDLDQHSSD